MVLPSTFVVILNKARIVCRLVVTYQIGNSIIITYFLYRINQHINKLVMRDIFHTFISKIISLKKLQVKMRLNKRCEKRWLKIH